MLTAKKTWIVYALVSLYCEYMIALNRVAVCTSCAAQQCGQVPSHGLAWPAMLHAPPQYPAHCPCTLRCHQPAAVCYMAQAPVLPYLTKQLGADVQAFGRLQAAFSAVQFAGGLLSGESGARAACPLRDPADGEVSQI